MFANVLKTDGRKFCLHSGRVSQRVMQVQVPAVSEENTVIVVWVSRGFWDGEGLTLFPANACLMKLTHKSVCEGQRRDFQHKFQLNLGSDADPLDLC